MRACSRAQNSPLPAVRRLPARAPGRTARLPRIWICAPLVCVLLAGPPLSAQWLRYPWPNVPRNAGGSPNLEAPLPRTPDGKPDLRGVWQSQNRGLLVDLGRDGADIPMRPAARAIYEQRLKHPGVNAPEAQCLPQGVPMVNSLPFPFKLQFAPGELVILYEGNNLFRQVFTDGRALPGPEANPAWLGYSIGRWEGDDFVIESSGFVPGMWLDTYGHPHSDQLRIFERFQRADYGHMNIQVTIDDAAMYERPWTVVQKLRLLPDTELLEFACRENNTSPPHLR